MEQEMEQKKETDNQQEWSAEDSWKVEAESHVTAGQDGIRNKSTKGKIRPRTEDSALTFAFKMWTDMQPCQNHNYCND